MVAGPPEENVDHVAVPAAVRDIAEGIDEGRAISPVWVNERGGVTFAVGAQPVACFVKWAPAGSGLDLTAEAARMAWAVAYTPVPVILGEGADAEGAWLATTAMPGENAVSERYRRDPPAAVAAVGAGLRALHDDLPVEQCPFSWSPAVRLDRAATLPAPVSRDDATLAVPVSWDDAAHRGLTVGEARRILDDPPPVDRLVVCHGDACAPNTLIDEGRWSGHVDLGALGVADRWADIAVATWSTQWNYGPGWEPALLDAYGIDPDPERTAWYRLLWDMT